MGIHIAVFGSAFNPPTLGHQSILKSLDHFDRILLVPNIAHAWGKSMLPFEHRCIMVEKFIADLGMPKLELCKIEQDIYDQSTGLVSTFNLLSALTKQYPQDRLTFVIGPDNLLKLSHFRNIDEILKRWSILSCPETLRVRSTLVRDAIKQKDSIYKTMLTRRVCEYVEQNKLYTHHH